MGDSGPDNVKPTPQNVPEAAKETPKESPKEASLREQSNTKSNIQLDMLKKERVPSFTNVPAFKSQPLLKLNHYSKNCSQEDSIDDPAEFVHKEWDYASQAPSCSSMTVEPMINVPKVAPPKVAPINRPEPPKVNGGSKTKIEHVKSKEKKKDDKTKSGSTKDLDSPTKEKKDKDSPGKEKDTNSKGSKKSKESIGSKGSNKA